MNFDNIKTHILRGAGLFFPFAAIIYGFNLALSIADGWFGSIVAAVWSRIFPSAPVPLHSPILSLTFMLLLLYSISLVVSWKLGRIFFNWLEARIYNIRGLGQIYGSLRKGIDMVANSDHKQSFKRVVMVPFTAGKGKTIAFVTNEIVDSISEQVYVVVMIPTPPNPISGLEVYFPKEEVVETDLTIDQALQMCMTLGIAAPASLPLSQAAKN